jgi:ribosylpyrimidine nucleosidase
MVMDKRKIILDCDPGHDDAIAIMMAAKHPKIDLLGITIVAGNQILDKTLVNGLHVCQQLGLDDSVYAGMSLPMVRDQVVAANIHGESGLDGPVFGPLVKKAEKTHAVQFIIETLMASEGDITLVPTGPLSNIAMAMRLEPRIIPKIQEIVLMGGAYGLGNVTAAAEFNIFVDPEAASVVFRSGVPIVMMGLDLTNQAQCCPEIISRMEKISNTASKLFSDIMNFVLKTQKEAFGFEGSPLHDSTTIAYLIDPGCIELKPMHTEVDIRSELCYGRTVCDYFNNSGKEPNSKVALKLDANKFWDIVEECIRLY